MLIVGWTAITIFYCARLMVIFSVSCATVMDCTLRASTPFSRYDPFFPLRASTPFSYFFLLFPLAGFASLLAIADELFPEPVYVSLKGSGQMPANKN